MKSKTFSGMGPSFIVHDAFATESQGPIQDRTHETLGSTDIAVVAARKILIKAIKDVQEGREAPLIVRDPRLNRFPQLVVISEVIPGTVNVKDYVHGLIREREINGQGLHATAQQAGNLEA